MKYRFLILLSITVLLLSGCKAKPGPPDNSDNIVPPGPEAELLTEKIEQMTLEEKIGQLVIVGLDGLTIDDFSQEMIDKYKVGGFILFQRNIHDSNQTIALIDSLKKANKSNAQPLFFAVDEEGGRVSRMPGEFSKLPTNKTVGKINSEELSFQIGELIGEELTALGFNMNFAPVLDIDSNPKNPVIGDRSFGADSKTVSTLGIATMKGIQSQVISVVKHFPGHGDTSTDSHVGLPFVSHDMDRLKEFELVPFQAAADNGADAVMTAHILLTAVDAENPATLSWPVITDILRRDMGFDGVVITDDMTMGAILENYDIGDAAVKSILAGTDIILVCHGHEKMTEVLESLKAAVTAGTIPESELDRRLIRILGLKQKYGINDNKTAPKDLEDINERIKKVLSGLGS